jgi:hypothetical protein
MQPRVPVVGSIQKESTQKKMYSHAWSIAFTKDEKMLQANSFHLFQTC